MKATEDCWEFCRRMLEDETCREVAVRTEAEFGGRRLREKSEKECFEAMDRTGYGELNEERLRCAIEMGLLVIIRISMLQLDQAADPRELKTWHISSLPYWTEESGIKNRA